MKLATIQKGRDLEPEEERDDDDMANTASNIKEEIPILAYKVENKKVGVAKAEQFLSDMKVDQANTDRYNVNQFEVRSGRR